jgi:acyl-coenzyme A thioesterase PaaI-like protein
MIPDPPCRSVTRALELPYAPDAMSATTDDAQDRPDPDHPEVLRRRALELADALRGVAESFSTAELGAEELAAAAALTRQLHERLDGPRRRRWYEGGLEATVRGPESRHEYLDRSPIRGVLNPIAPPLELKIATRKDGTREIAGRARLGAAYEGPPHGVHGGWIAALFDEVLGATQALEGLVGVTAILTVKYREFTPVDEELRFTGWVVEKRARRVVARATCHARNRLTADARGIFIPVDFDEVRRRMSPE